jgi:hypothetical protein
MAPGVVFYGVAAAVAGAFVGGFGAWLRFCQHIEQRRKAWDREREAWHLRDREHTPNPIDFEDDRKRRKVG